jgi:hypothetical protein
MYFAANPECHHGQAVGSGHCVAFVQAAANCPHTSHWRPGRRVRGGQVERGTAIATFQEGRYGNHTDGRSHAAILLAEEGGGLRVLDQWRGQPVHERVIRFKGGQGTPNNDGDAFRVIEGPEPAPARERT